MKRVTIVGVGALGSHAVQFLRNIDATLRVVDFDRIEAKNVQAQMHSKPNIGLNKAQSLAKTMNFLFGTKIEANTNRLVADNARELLGSSDLVIDAMDNAASRKLMQDFVRKHQIPCLHGALAADGLYGRVVWDPSFTIDSEDSGGATCEDGQFLPFIAVVAAHLALSAQSFLRTGKQVGFEISPSGSIRT